MSNTPRSESAAAGAARDADLSRKDLTNERDIEIMNVRSDCEAVFIAMREVAA